MKLLERIRKADEILNHLWDSGAFGIYKELTMLGIEKDDESLEHLIKVGLAVYEDNEYATPTGVGMAICNLFDYEYACKQKCLEVTQEQVYQSWLGGERT